MGLANTIGGVVMQHSTRLVWLVPLAASLLGVAGALSLRRHIPAHIAVSA